MYWLCLIGIFCFGQIQSHDHIDGLSISDEDHNQTMEHNISKRSASFHGKGIPGGLQSHQVPQFVLLTFDDAVNDLNKEFYSRLFAPQRKNPNGCGIKATMYVSHEWTDYAQVQTLFSQGHEIASHTVTHSSPSGFSRERWAKEVIGQAENFVKYAGIPPDQIKGMRAPFLQTGGDKMFSVLADYGFLYDSSLPSSVTSPALWPYTVDQALPHGCSLPPCPTGSHPGLWEIPMTHLSGDAAGPAGAGVCAMLDACSYSDDTENGIQRVLTKNFINHYTSSSKAPLPLFYHAAWFRLRPHRERALLNFIDSILELPDVYFVTSRQLIDWVKSPSPIQQYVLECPTPLTPPCPDNIKRVCKYGDNRKFHTCARSCPPKYPWVGN